MKIALFHNLPSGGALRALYGQARAFQKKGYGVTLYTFSTHDRYFLPLGNSFETRIEPLEFRGRRRFSNYFKATENTARALEASGADRVLVEKCRFFGSPPLLRYLNHRSVFYTQEPLRIREYETSRQGHSLTELLRSAGRLRIHFLIKKEDRKAMRAASRVMTNSQFTAGWIKRVYGVDARVVYQGVDTDFFCPDRATDRKQEVLSVGRVDRTKGHDFIIRALGLMPEKKRPGLTIVCDFIDTGVLEELEREADRYAVRLSVRHRIPDEDLRQVYRESAMTLCAAIHEPFGLVPLESMACGTAVIAVDEGGFKETMIDGKTGYLLARDEKMWADRMGHLLSHPLESARMGRDGRNHVLAEWQSDFFVSRFEDNLI